MSQDQLDMTLDECVAKKHKECVEPSFEYMEWLCGAEELCLTKGSNYQKKMLAVELTKHRVQWVDSEKEKNNNVELLFFSFYDF